MFRHLTNYAVSRKHQNHIKTNDENEGSKRSFTFLEDYLVRHAGLTDPRLLWRQIYDLVVKTIILAAPHIYHSYRLFHRSSDFKSCSSITANSISTNSDMALSEAESIAGTQSAAFEILGFDVLLDEDLKPWLLEVNRSPSFAVDQELDLRVKSALLKDALSLVNIR